MVAERNGVRGGTKLPPRVAESAPSGLAPPGGGPTWAAFQTLGPRTSARERPGEATHDCSPHCQHCSLFASLRPPPSVISLPGYKGSPPGIPSS